MNNARRKQLQDITDNLTTLRATLECQMESLEALKDDEQEAFDNMPEGLQDSDRGQSSQVAIEHLEDAWNNLDSMLSELDDAMSRIEQAGT